MKKFLQRLGRTRFMILFFILLVAVNYWYSGWLGIIAAVIGWCIGDVIYYWKDYKPRIIKFFRHNTNLKVKTIVFIPVAAWCVYYVGWRGLLVAIAGWCVGELICRRFLKRYTR